MNATQQQQPDMGRVVERAAQNISALAVAPLGAQLAMAQEVADLARDRVAQLEVTVREKDEALEQKDAELGRALQTASLLQERIQQLEGELAAATAEQSTGEGAAPA